MWTGWFDGAAAPNPGAKSIGIVLVNPDGEVIEVSSVTGQGTNNEAEYDALIALLRTAHEHGATKLRVHGDNALVINQVSGKWTVGTPSLAPLHQAARALLATFQHCELVWVSREQNEHADTLSRRALGRHATAAAPRLRSILDSVQVHHVRDNIWIATGTTGSLYAIDVAAEVCSCPNWKAKRKPCKHLEKAIEQSRTAGTLLEGASHVDR